MEIIFIEMHQEDIYFLDLTDRIRHKTQAYGHKLMLPL